MGHRGVERAVVGRKWQGARGENLLERPRVPTGLVSGQHVLRLVDQNLLVGDQLLLQQGLRLVSGLDGLHTEQHGHERDDGGDRRHGNESVSVPQRGRAPPGGFEFGLLAFRAGRHRRLLVFRAAAVALFAYDTGEHIVREFDTLRAVALLEP